MFTGSMVALITPFKDGKVDWQSLEAVDRFSHPERHPWDRALRHHRRVGDPESPRTRRGHQSRHQSRQ